MVVLGQRDRQVDVDKEVLEDFDAAASRCRAAPAGCCAIALTRQVVIESAIGIVSSALPCSSVMSAGFQYIVSGKYSRTRGAAAAACARPSVWPGMPFVPSARHLR